MIEKLRMLARNRQRLAKKSFSFKLRYVTRTLVGEFLGLRAVRKFGLRLVEIGVTDRCNCRCEHCFAANMESQDQLTVSEVRLLLQE